MLSRSGHARRKSVKDIGVQSGAPDHRNYRRDLNATELFPLNPCLSRVSRPCDFDVKSTLVLISQRLGIDATVIESLIKQISLRTIQEFNERASKDSMKVVVKEETPKSWLTRDQAAHLIGVSPKTISNWSTQGKLRRHGLNGSSRGLARYFRADVESVIEKKGTRK